METIYGDFVLCDKSAGEVKLEVKADKLLITVTKDSCCSQKKEHREVLFQDIIGIRLLNNSNGKEPRNEKGLFNEAAEVEGQTVAVGNAGNTRFALTFKQGKTAKRSGLTSHSTRTLVLRCLSTNLGQEVLDQATATLANENASENEKSETLTPAQLWVQAIAVARMRSSGIANVTGNGEGRGRRLLVLVNPKSGVGSAAKIYKNVLEPILREAQIPHDMVLTTRGNYGRDLVVAEDVSRWSGIVIISGDGLLFEVLQVLSIRLVHASRYDFSFAFSPTGLVQAERLGESQQDPDDDPRWGLGEWARAHSRLRERRRVRQKPGRPRDDAQPHRRKRARHGRDGRADKERAQRHQLPLRRLGLLRRLRHRERGHPVLGRAALRSVGFLSSHIAASLQGQTILQASEAEVQPKVSPLPFFRRERGLFGIRSLDGAQRLSLSGQRSGESSRGERRV